MKQFLLAAVVVGASLGAAQAAELRMTVEQPHFTCAGHIQAFSRVAYRPGQDPSPLPCCDGQLGCAQFLSTNTVVRQDHEWHG